MSADNNIYTYRKNISVAFVIMLIIGFCSISVSASEKILLRYIKNNEVISYYSGVVENSIPSQPSADLKLAMKSQRLPEGKIKSSLQFILSVKNKRFGPMQQTLEYDFLGNFKSKEKVDPKDRNRYIDLSVFFPHFPVDRIKEGEQWKEYKSLSDYNGNENDVIIVNKIIKLNGEDNTVQIKSKGLNNKKTYYILRDIVFDYENGEIKESKVRILNKATEMGQITSTMEIKKQEKEED